MKLREETILIHEIQTLNHNTVLISMALEGEALPPLHAGWGARAPGAPLLPPPMSISPQLG